MCHTCSAYCSGVICEYSKILLKYLDGMKEFYERHIPDAVENYRNFEEVLHMYSAGRCSGCRVQNTMDAALKDAFCLSVQKIMVLIFVENVMNFLVKKQRNCLKSKYICSG